MNDEVDKSIRDLFLISLFLVAVVYFVGLTSDVSTVFTSLSGLINTATGRDSTGKFAGYPTK